MERRAKVRKRIEFLTENVENKYNDMKRVASDQDLMTEDVKGILNSVERALAPN